MSFRSIVAIVLVAGLASAQVELPSNPIGPKAYPFPIAVRLHDQLSSSVWFIAGDAIPQGIDGLYNPALDVLVRRDTSVMRRFAQGAYGRTTKPSPRPPCTLPPRGLVESAPEPLDGTLQRIAGALNRPFVTSLGSFVDLGVIDFSDQITINAARRIAAIAALTGADFRLPKNRVLSPERAALVARTHPPVEAWCADAFPKTSTPDVIVRHHQRGATTQTTIAILGSAFDRVVNIPLRDLGLPSEPHVFADMFDGGGFESERSELVCFVPKDGIRLFAAARKTPEPALLFIGDQLSGGLDQIQSIAFEGKGGECQVHCLLVDETQRPTHITVHSPELGVATIQLESVAGDAKRLTSHGHRWKSQLMKQCSTRSEASSRPTPHVPEIRSWPDFQASPWADGFRRNQSAWGTPLRINGTPVVHGIGTITGTKASIPFEGKAKSLSFLAGPATEGQARINILCDGTLKASIDVGGAAPSAFITIDLRGAQTTIIEVMTPTPTTRPVDVTLTNIELALN